MLGNTQVEVLEILIRAKDQSQATLRETAAHVEGMRGHLAGLGQGMMTAGLGIGGAVAAIAGGALKLAADFEHTMSGVQAVSGASAQQMKQLSGLALQLGKDTAFSATEAGKAIEELVKGGVSIADIMNGAATATLNLAAAGGVDLPTAAAIAANALNTFGLAGRDMAHVADMIAGAANASSLDVNDFKFSLAAAGSIAKTIGFSFDDLSVAIAELGAAGLRGSDAGTSLKTLFINLSPQTSHAADMMKKLGIITKDNHNLFFDHAGRIRSLAAVQGVLHRALSGLTKEQQINALHTMFGTDAMRAAAIMAGQGAAGYDRMSAAMRKVTAEGVAATRLGNLAGQIEQLKGSLETLGIIIGQALLPPATAFVKALTGIVNHGIEIAQRLGPDFIKTALAIGGIAAAALTAGGAIAMIVAVMNPIGLAVTALVAGVGLLGAAWATNWGGIRDTVAGVWAAIEPTLQILRLFWDDIANAFSSGGLAGGLGAIVTDAQTLFGVLVDWVGSTALPALQGALLRWARAFIGWIGPQIPPLLALLGQLKDQVTAWITGVAWPALVSAAGRWGTALWTWVTHATPPLLAHLGTLLRRLGGWITGTAAPALLHALGRWAGAFWGWVQRVSAPLLAHLGSLLGRLWSWITGTAWPRIQQAVGRWATAFWGWVQHVAPPILSALGALLGRLGTWITGTAWPWLRQHVGTWAHAFWAWVKDVTPPLLAHLGALLGRLGGWIMGTGLPRLAHALGGWAGAFWGWVQHVVPHLLAHLGALLGRLWAWITGTALPRIGHALGGWATAFGKWVGPAIIHLVTHLGPMLDRLGGWIGTTALPTIGKKLEQWGTAFWRWLVVAGPKMEHQLGEFLGKMIVWIPTATAVLIAKVYEWGTAFIGWILPRLADLYIKLNQFLAKIGEWILTKALPGLLKFGWDMGSGLLSGMAKGIKDAGGGVIHALTHVLDHAKDHAKKHTKTHSPSLVYAGIGKDMMAGLAQGISQNSALATTAVSTALNGAQQAGEHWVTAHLVRAHHVAAHMIAGHYTHAGHWVKAHMVRAHEIAAHMVAGHWAHNPGHAAAAAALSGRAASASTLAGAATTGAGGVQLVALVSASGSPLDPLPVTLVTAAGHALALSGGAASAALGVAGGTTGATARALTVAAATHVTDPLGAFIARGEQTLLGLLNAPAPSGSRLTWGAHPHAVQINVHVHDGAVQVHDPGGHPHAGVGQHVADAIAGALEDVAQSQLRTPLPARHTLPGATS